MYSLFVEATTIIGTGTGTGGTETVTGGNAFFLNFSTFWQTFFDYLVIHCT